LKLNLGSGTNPREGFVNVDANAAHKPDRVALLPPIPFPDESCELVFSSHFLEHLTKADASRLVAEAWRVLVPGGEFEAIVPYAFHEWAVQDPTHLSFWVPESFYYYTEVYNYLSYGLETRFAIKRSACERGREVHVVMVKVLS
jgi:predicted SAM-dependent methyltransferase